MSYFTTKWAADSAERAILTFVEVYLATLLLYFTTDFPTMDNQKTAIVAGVAAALSVLKGALGNILHKDESASILKVSKGDENDSN